MAALKRSTNDMSSYQKKIFKVDDHMVNRLRKCVPLLVPADGQRGSLCLANFQMLAPHIGLVQGISISGLTADARSLCKYMRTECLQHKYVYESPVTVQRLVVNVADKCQECTQSASGRPFGVGLLVAGVDQTGPHIYYNCPSGNYYEYKAMTIGARSQVPAPAHCSRMLLFVCACRLRQARRFMIVPVCHLGVAEFGHRASVPGGQDIHGEALCYLRGLRSADSCTCQPAQFVRRYMAALERAVWFVFTMLAWNTVLAVDRTWTRSVRRVRPTPECLISSCFFIVKVKHCLTSLKETAQNGDINAKNTSVRIWHLLRACRSAATSHCKWTASGPEMLSEGPTAMFAGNMCSIHPEKAWWQVSIVGIGHEFKTFDGEDVQQYIDLMDKDEIAEAPADAAMQE